MYHGDLKARNRWFRAPNDDSVSLIRGLYAHSPGMPKVSVALCSSRFPGIRFLTNVNPRADQRTNQRVPFACRDGFRMLSQTSPY